MQKMLTMAAALMIGAGTYVWASSAGDSAGKGGCCPSSAETGCPMAAKEKHGEHKDGKHAAKAEYPLNECVVSGEKLGEHGDPYVFQHEGQEVRLCCKACLKDFKKDPAKYVKKIEAAKQAGSKHDADKRDSHKH